MTALATPPPTLLQVVALGVYWSQDLRAEEQGYALLYRAAGTDSSVAMTLLADERGTNDAPLYVGDQIELRCIGSCRHVITRNLTRHRSADAQRIDWDAIWASAQGIAPAQLSDNQRNWLDEAGPHSELAALDSPMPEHLRDQLYAHKYPSVHTWLQNRKGRMADPGKQDLPPIDPPEQPGNGGW